MPATTDGTGLEPLTDDNTTPDHLGASTNPFTIANAKKAYSAGLVAVLAAAGGLTVTQFIQNGSLDVHALGTEALALAGLFAVTFIGAWLPRNN